MNADRFLTMPEAEKFAEELTKLTKKYKVVILGQFWIERVEDYRLSPQDGYGLSEKDHQILEYIYRGK